MTVGKKLRYYPSFAKATSFKIIFLKNKTFLVKNNSFTYGVTYTLFNET